MKMYEKAGLTDFVICCGYKGQMIKNYFVNYFTENYDITIDLASNEVAFLGQPSEKWKVTLVDTGAQTMTGGRVKRIASHIGQETFCLTYGDGVTDVDLRKVIAHHKAGGRKATVTAVPSPGRFGILELGKEGAVTEFREKPNLEMGWINGGFFVLEPSVFSYIDGDDTTWERAPLERLAAEGQLTAYKHAGFWRAMDTLRDKRELEDLWASARAPWKVW
jgi:glucose-1-phosphate cytidylyltransferase